MSILKEVEFVKRCEFNDVHNEIAFKLALMEIKIEEDFLNFMKSVRDRATDTLREFRIRCQYNGDWDLSLGTIDDTCSYIDDRLRYIDDKIDVIKEEMIKRGIELPDTEI